MLEPQPDPMLAWTIDQMRATRAACERLGDLRHVRLAYSGHLSLNIVPALTGILQRGAKLFLTTCNSTTVRDEVVRHLVTQGAEARAWKGMSEDKSQQAVAEALAWEPTHTCEMGAELTVAASCTEPCTIRGALEATGSGINRLGDLDVRYPVFNWDDLPIKEGLHNRHMVGLTTWQMFFDRTRLSLHGKRVVVVGYGLVGEGLATTARAFGGVVAVVDHDPTRRLQARYAGWHTATLKELAPATDVLVTATGARGVIDAEVLTSLKSGCFVLNVGHLADEIDFSVLSDRREVLPQIEACRIDNREIYLIAGGSMANLTAGHGDSLNAFDVTSAVLVAGVGFIAGLDDSWSAGVHPLPREVWQSAAEDAAAEEGW